MDPTIATPYYEDMTERLMRYFRNEFGDYFHAYMEGDPYDIPQSLLPCLIVSEQKGTSNPGPVLQQDQVSYILVQLVFNKKDDFGAAKAYPNVEMTNRRLRQMVKGRDVNTAQYLPHTIMGVLSKNITLGQDVLQMTTDYEFPMAQRMQGMITQEAHITVMMRERVNVLVRE